MTQQQYTPVSWQDETTSQQGTLINAERLNQMQTAHHYADGFEEVDTVPSADPGVDYHKIVYCTADSTIYRWNGSEWEKDIDDPTRELQEEHEADHDNPHQVTKAQVGLGNADNTADLDKPISTATQTALNAKADKSDTYTKAQTDSLLGGKVDKQDSSAGMIAYTAEEGTEGSTEINAGAKPATIPIRTADGRLRAYFDDADPYADDCVTYTWTSGQLTDIRGTLDYKADKATTLAGYGITDAYTKTEADTLLGAKADQATTYTKSEVQTYVSNALDGYLPMVRTTGTQDIAGTKKFISQISINGIFDNKNCQNTENTGMTWRRLYYNTGTPANQMLYLAVTPQKPVLGPNDYGLLMVGGTNGNDPVCTWILKGSEIVNADFVCTWSDATGFELWARNETGNRGICCIKINETSWGSPANNWVADQTTIDANFDPTAYTKYKVSTDAAGAPVTLVGNQTINGVKTFTSSGFTYINVRSDRTSGNIGGIIFQDGNNVGRGQIYGETTGKIVLEPLGDTKAVIIKNQRTYSAGNTTDVATIGTLDAYTPMVRTTGNQTITGVKTLQTSINSALEIKTTIADLEVTPTGYPARDIVWTCSNDAPICRLRFQVSPSGERQLVGFMSDKDGTAHAKILMSMTIEGVVS